ncbi:MAG: SusC/RagA family TonB-linked outer membrane protein [Bacteroidales bacterium]|nr:SusC/RagA family TonB-linked outer membrane protein [Bacteroidales bacterium]
MKKNHYLKKILQIMRISFLLWFACFINLSANIYSQKFSFNKTEDVTIKDMLAEIETKSNFKFLYRSDLVNVSQQIKLDIKDADIDDLLSTILDPSELTYKIFDDSLVVITNKINQQLQKVTGIVKDENGNPMPGVNVQVEGTTTGAITDIDGKYFIEKPNENAVLVFSFIGCVTQKVSAFGKTVMDVTLNADVKALEEVVVTALGIKRDVKALGYSVSKVNGEDVAQSHETNMANALSGKVAGVFVNRTASGASGSSKVLIRGNNSLRTNSQPLYVIDGVPIMNINLGSAGNWGGTDYGDGISNINPEDIESMSVLKGPNATALYGQRGNNGVILITTKSGKMKKALGVNFSSDYSVGNGLVLPDFQNIYGQGYNGTFTHFRRSDTGKIVSYASAIENGYAGMPKTSAGRDQLTRGSWGAKMEGQQYEDQFGNILTFDPQPNTYKDFFNPEKTFTNNLSFDGGTEKMNYRFSAANMHNDGYVPTNTLDRNTFNLKIGSAISPKLHFEGMVNYINQKVVNRPALSNGNTNPAYLLISMPRSMPLSTQESMAWTAPEIAGQLGYKGLFEGMEKCYATNSNTANPYWTIRKSHNEDQRDRLIGYFKLSYDITPWLKVTGKTGTDYSADQILQYRPEKTYSSTNKNGDISEYVTRTRETNSDIMFSSNFKAGNNIDISLNAGGNRQKYSARSVGYAGYEFIVPDMHVINNAKTQYPSFGLSESAINSVFGSGQIGYSNYLFVDMSARNDWSSTLPLKNCSFFYPSFGVSFIPSEAFNIKNGWLDFLKVRASVAQAGSSGSPYSLIGTYSLYGYKQNGISLGGYTSTVVDPNLKNELTTSYEGGVDVNLFQNRLMLNFTYYVASTKNQILSVPISTATSFSSRTINAGEIENKGVELMISATPVKTSTGFTWETSFNFSRNRNTVVELVEGTNRIVLAEDRGVYTVAEPGKPFGKVLGTKFAWLKDAQGNRLIDSGTGLPLKTSDFVTTELGNAMPDWLGGFSNTLSFKGLRLYALVDISQGGIVISSSSRETILYGNTNKTVEGRDGTYVAKGVLATKEGNSWISTGVANTMQVKAQDYWNTVASDKENFVSEELVNDLSYISMREISLSYTIPKKITEKTFIKNIVVGAYGRNLFYFQRKTDGFSPEACSYSQFNSALGIESTSLPMMRTIGFNISIGL